MKQIKRTKYDVRDQTTLSHTTTYLYQACTLYLIVLLLVGYNLKLYASVCPSLMKGGAAGSLANALFLSREGGGGQADDV
eukprot:scaffold178861_cov55-Attheya_sp.AAC.2